MTNQTIFDHIEPVRFEGKESRNPLAYRYYDKDRPRVEVTVH